jgi:hypothetical protein
MMLVKIMGFGSNWWARFGRDPLDRYRHTRHAAYFNSTGLRCGNKIRRYWIVPGLVRFNGVGDFNPQFPLRSVGATFECTDLVFALGGNRILFQREAVLSARPDYFLVALSSERFGVFDSQNPGWKSHSVLPLAVSQSRERQEAMVLMKPLDWVRTVLGVWQLRPDGSLPHGVSLELLGGAIIGEGVDSCDTQRTA